jgi:hypothetical protein
VLQRLSIWLLLVVAGEEPVAVAVLVDLGLEQD